MMIRFLAILAILVLFCQNSWAESISFLNSGKGRLRMAKFVADDFTFTEVAGELSIKDGIISVSQLTAKAMGGSVVGRASFDLNIFPPSYEVEIDLLDCEAEELKRQIDIDTYFLNGKLNGRIKITGKFDDANPTMLITGHLKMTARENDILTYAEADITYRLHHLTLSNIYGREPANGTVNANLEVLFEKGSTRIIGTVGLQDVGIHTLARIGKDDPEWLDGHVTGNSELRLCFGKGMVIEDCLTNGIITSSSFTVFGVPITGAANFTFDGDRLTVRDFVGQSCGGSVKGMFYTENAGSRVEVAGEKVRLAEVLKALKLGNELSGDTTFTTAFETKTNVPGLTGDWFVEVKNGLLTKAPGIMSVVTLLGLPTFGQHEFTEGKAKMRFNGRRIVVDDAQLVSKRLTLQYGTGYVDFDGPMHMQFDIYSEGTLLSLLLGKFGSAIANLLDPVSKVFKVEIKGTIGEPAASMRAFSKRIDKEGAPPEQPTENQKEGDK